METVLTVLIENTSNRPGLHSQHGLSLWIEAGDAAILVDSGQDAAFLSNSALLGVDLHRTDLLFLTHGHYDHTGGVPAVLSGGIRPRVVVHPRAWETRRSLRQGETPRDVGIPWPRELLTTSGLAVQEAATAVELLPGVWSTGTISNLTGHRTSPELQRARAGGWEPDMFPDEQALILRTVEGLVVVTGCCHTGVVNTLRMAQQVTGTDTIYALVGGLHLHRAPTADVAALAGSLAAFGIPHLWVNHCTGSDAFTVLRKRLGPCVAWAGTGFRAELPPLLARGEPCR